MSLPKAAIPFEEHAEQYDRWYDTSPLFDMELAAIRAITTRLNRPGLEVGVGPGRFARALGIEFGIDPALSPLQLARRRSIIPINAIGENLPIRSGSIGTLYLFFTLCFLTDPAAAFREFFRVLKPEGLLMLGIIPAGSGWGQDYIRKGREQNPFYRHARFRTIAETGAMLTENGFEVLETWSTLFQAPSKDLQPEDPRPGADEKAGACVLLAGKKKSIKGAFREKRQPDHPDH